MLVPANTLLRLVAVFAVYPNAQKSFARYHKPMGRKLGTSGRVVRRSELKPKKPLTDEQLLAQAWRDYHRYKKTGR